MQIPTTAATLFGEFPINIQVDVPSAKKPNFWILIYSVSVVSVLRKEESDSEMSNKTAIHLPFPDKLTFCL